MRDAAIWQEYSADREYRFEVYQNPGFYEVWVQKRITVDYMGEWVGYHDIPDAMHHTDTLERAIETGRECLSWLGDSGKEV